MLKPYVPAKKNLKEFSFRALVLGCILSLLFGISNAYLGLKVGTTISASIPAAILSMAILRTFFKRSTILENNLVQTIASVGEGLAAGIVYTVPALFILGNPPSIFQIFLLAFLGGILGVLFMIPMRRFIIVEEHGKLPFPEGIACAEILKSGEKESKEALLAILGIGIGAIYKIGSSAFHLWKEVITWKLPRFYTTELSLNCTPALLGVGYIIGPRISSILFAGGLLGWWVLIPLIAKFGVNTTTIFPGTIPISQMSAEGIWENYIRYIGAGTIAFGGVLSLFKIFPLISKIIKTGIKELFGHHKHRKNLPRTDQDISLRWLILGPIAIILFLWLYPGFSMNLMTICLLVILGFLFVAVTSITVGLIGSTSSPVSGMTITTLLITCFIFVSLGWTERMYLLAALTMAIVVNVAISLSGTTSQDLKTGYIIGATPKWQQVGEIIGAILPAMTIGATLYLLNKAYTFGSVEIPAPQGTLMALIAKGVIAGNIPYVLVILGLVLGLILELMHLPILPFAIGLYLPLSLSTSVMLGGLFSWMVQRRKDQTAINRGVLTASGLIAGDACTGVVIALFTVIGIVSPTAPSFFPNVVSFLLFALLGIGLIWISSRMKIMRNQSK